MFEKEKIIQIIQEPESQFKTYLTSHGRVLEYVLITTRDINEGVEAGYELIDTTPDVEKVRSRLST